MTVAQLVLLRSQIAKCDAGVQKALYYLTLAESGHGSDTQTLTVKGMRELTEVLLVIRQMRNLHCEDVDEASDE